MRHIFPWKWLLMLEVCAAILTGCGAALPPPTGVPSASPTPPLPATLVPLNSPIPQMPASAVPPSLSTAPPSLAATPTFAATPAGGDQMNSDPNMAPLVEQARADLAQRLGSSAESFKLKRAEAVEWRDTSLGCPKPGLMYAQVITPGYLIVLEANGKEYEYHADRRRASLCEK